MSLLFVGPIEKEDTIDIELFDYFKKCDSIIKTGRVSDVSKYMATMDIFILPSYREGFGMSVVEASAMGIPVIATKYPGPSSAMRMVILVLRLKWLVLMQLSDLYILY